MALWMKQKHCFDIPELMQNLSDGGGLGMFVLYKGVSQFLAALHPF